MTPFKKVAYVPPYISAGEFTKFMSLLRIRVLDHLTPADLQKLGISYSNSFTLFGTLKSMGLYDDQGKALERKDLIDLGSKEQATRQAALERIFNRTYADWLERYSIEDATLQNVEDYFTVKGAARSISIKAARLLLWLAEQAGLRTVEDTSVETKPETSTKSTHKAKEDKRNIAKGKTNSNGSDKPFPAIRVKTADEAEDWLLNSLLEKISSTDEIPSAEIVQQARELIASKRERSKSHHTNTPEPSVEKEHGKE